VHFLAVVDRLAGEQHPQGEVGEMGADVGQGPPGLDRVEPPRGPTQELAGHRLLEEVRALQCQRRVVRRAGDQGPEDVGIADQLALQGRRHLVPLGHDVPREDVAQVGFALHSLEFREIARVDHPRLVGQDVQPVRHGGQDQVDLSAVAPSNDDGIPRLLAEHPVEVISARANVELPRRGGVGS
jgi:hypothetical protein